MSAVALQNTAPGLTSLSDGHLEGAATGSAGHIPQPVSPRVLRWIRTAAPSAPAHETWAEDGGQRATRETLAHHWECTVESVGRETFSATLRSLLKPGDTEKEAELPLDDVNADDRELLAPGAIFYWIVGSERTPKGTVTRFSRIKFRRLPGWTKRDLARVEEEAARLFAMFGGGGAQDESRGR